MLNFISQKNASIRILNVSWNGFDVAGCHGLSHGLSKNSTLVDLDLCSNRVGIIGLSKLVEGMKRNSTLEVLRVRLSKFFFFIMNYYLIFLINM